MLLNVVRAGSRCRTPGGQKNIPTQGVTEQRTRDGQQRSRQRDDRKERQGNI